jgi:hypothetical protein
MRDFMQPVIIESLQIFDEFIQVSPKSFLIFEVLLLAFVPFSILEVISIRQFHHLLIGVIKFHKFCMKVFT